MKEISEQINLKYMVEFEDGLKPYVFVYGIYHETGEIYGADAFISFSVGAGRDVKIAEKQTKKNYNEIISECIGKLEARPTIMGRGRLIENPEFGNEDWEQKIYEKARKHRLNVIKIEDPLHLDFAINKHSELYIKQFWELMKKFETLFEEFVKEHPGYDYKRL